MRWKKKILAAGTLLILLSFAPTAQAAESHTYTHQQEFSADYKLQGLFATCYQSFQAGDWDIEDAEITLYYTATMLVREKISDFTVSVNGRPVYSGKIPATDGETQKLEINIPGDCIQSGTNQITIESYIRTNEEDPCQDDVTQANWMMILKDSFLTIRYTPKADCGGISDIYGQLTSIEALENGESAVILPGEPSETELTAAAFGLTGMSGNAAVSYDTMQLQTTDDYNSMSEWKYVLYISGYDSCMKEILNGMSKEQQRAAKEEAVIAFLKGKDGGNILAVVGGSGDALLNASRLLANADNMRQTQSVWRRISAKEKVTYEYDTGKAGLLTENGYYLSGPFQQSASFYIEQASDRQIAVGSSLTLKYRYSENLDFSRSLVTVYLGDTPIGSRKLTREAANNDSFTIDIPVNPATTGSFNLNVRFDLEIDDLACALRRQDMPWAYVSNDSTLDLKTEEVPWLLFDYFPSPFIRDGRLNDIAVILPARPSTADLSAFRGLMLTLGRYLKENTGEISVYRADSSPDLTQANVISIGIIAENRIAEQLNDRLYFRFSPKRTTILSNEKMQIAPDYGAKLGTAQLLYSPWSAEKQALLIISGVTEDGMTHAAEYLSSVEKSWNLSGDAYVADRENAYPYRFGEDNAKKQPLSVRLTTQTDLLWLVITGGCLTFLILCAFVLLMRKYRQKGAKKRGGG